MKSNSNIKSDIFSAENTVFGFGYIAVPVCCCMCCHHTDGLKRYFI